MLTELYQVIYRERRGEGHLMEKGLEKLIQDAIDKILMGGMILFSISLPFPI